MVGGTALLSLTQPDCHCKQSLYKLLIISLSTIWLGSSCIPPPMIINQSHLISDQYFNTIWHWVATEVANTPHKMLKLKLKNISAPKMNTATIYLLSQSYSPYTEAFRVRGQLNQVFIIYDCLLLVQSCCCWWHWWPCFRCFYCCLEMFYLAYPGLGWAGVHDLTLLSPTVKGRIMSLIMMMTMTLLMLITVNN